MVVATKKKKSTCVLVGIAGSNNAFSLSLYNLKGFALQESTVRDQWKIKVIQHPLIAETTQTAKIAALTESIVKSKPSLVGFSTYMWNVPIFRMIAASLRQQLPTTSIVWGGPEIATEHIAEGKFDDLEADYLIAGEGELTFRELLESHHSGAPDTESIHGLAWRGEDGGFVVNEKRHPFDSLLRIPSPFLSGVVDDEVLKRPKVEANIETQRGCNLRCSYCIYHKDMNKISYSSTDRTLDEIRFVINKGVKRIRFVDANFTSDLEHAKTIMRAMIDARFETRLMFELIPGFIDEELAALFGEFNSLYPWNDVTCGVGVQTINETVLKRIKRRIVKEKFEKTFDLLQKYGVFTKIDLIIGLPGEDLESIEATQEYMLEQLSSGQRHLLCCHVMRGLPGTELLQIAEDFEMRFSSENEPHELVESPILPREDMIKCLRRTAIIFRLTNHEGWADREFLSGRQSEDLSVRDEFFKTRDALKTNNLGVIDKLIEHLSPSLEERGSAFTHPNFPAAETWWWNYSSMEIRNDEVVEALRGMRGESALVTS